MLDSFVIKTTSASKLQNVLNVSHREIKDFHKIIKQFILATCGANQVYMTCYRSELKTLQKLFSFNTQKNFKIVLSRHVKIQVHIPATVLVIEDATVKMVS